MVYEDNVYDTKVNREICEENDIQAWFHSKEEKGKRLKHIRSKKITNPVQNRDSFWNLARKYGV